MCNRWKFYILLAIGGNAVDENPLTATQVAKLCFSSREGVINWIQSGKLKAYRTPIGRGHYRILPSDLVDFLKKHKMPIPSALRGVGTKRILIADDEPQVLDMIEKGLRMFLPDATIEKSQDGYECLIKAGALKPDLVILDLKMPHVDGIEVCKRLRSAKETSDVKILVITGYADRNAAIQMGQEGVDEYLSKPLTLADLEQKVKHLLELD